MDKKFYRNTNPINGRVWGVGFAPAQEACWFVNYDFGLDETALVIGGSDGIGVFFLVLRGDHRDEFSEVIEKYYKPNDEVKGCLGECIRFAAAHKDVIPERCTIGGVFSSRLGIRESLLGSE